MYARPNANNNPATIVKVSKIKGTEAFDLLNSIPTRGNVLSIYGDDVVELSLIHISEPTRLLSRSYAVFCLKKKKQEIAEIQTEQKKH